MLEELVEAELAQSLDRIAYECRCPTFGKAARALLGDCDLEAGTYTLVLVSIRLHAAFHQV